MNYNQLIDKLKEYKKQKSQVKFLFDFLLQNAKYDYLYLELERLKKLDADAYIDLYDKDLRENAFMKIMEKTEISREVISYFKNHEWEIRSNGEADPRFDNGGILVKGVCRHYSIFIKRVCDDLGIKCEVQLGRTPLGHAWNVIDIDEPLHYDLTYAIYARDKFEGWDKTKPEDWLGVTEEQLLMLQPNRTTINPNTEVKQAK